MSNPARVRRALQRLTAAERERQAAISELYALGAIRSRSLVGDLGEQYAARYYGVPVGKFGEPGFDLLVDGKRIQVKTLRSTPHNVRTVLGQMKEPYDVLFAIRLDDDFAPVEALEIPREVIDEQFETRRVTWTRRLENDPRTRRISADELLSPPARRQDGT